MFGTDLSLLCLLFSSITLKSATALANNTGNGKAIIIDTDIMGDVDDVGALAVANVLHNCGMADLKAVMINTNSSYGALATSVINTYFNNANIPIAALRPLTNNTYFDTYTYTTSEYTSKLAMNFPRHLQSAQSTPSPLTLYHSTLTSADPKSLTIISLGFLSNLATLLQSPNTTSLLESKISELVIMGGTYPGPDWEYNLGYQDPLATAALKGYARDDSPVLAAYEYYVGRGSTVVRESWDPVTVLYGILGLDGFEKLGMKDLFAYANDGGYNAIVEANGTNAWVQDSSISNQRWLKLADGVSNSSIAWVLDQFYVHDPVDKSCFDS